MKKLLAAVLAVALVAVVGVAATTRPAPVAEPENDVVVPAADVTAPEAAPVETAVLGDFTANDEPVATADELAVTDAEEEDGDDSETGDDENGSNVPDDNGDSSDSDTEDTDTEDIVFDEEFKYHHTTTADDGVSIDANGDFHGLSWMIAENSNGNVTYNYSN